MSTSKVSVIVPVHNAGTFFQKRLDTLVNQTLKEIEIILVLDCPTDGSDQIAEDYAQRDKRIILVRNQQNLHIGLSRNEGLKKATGEYVCFSDHDDYSELDMLEKMYQKAKKEEADVVVCDFYRESQKGTFYFGFPHYGSELEFRQNSFSTLINSRSERGYTSNGANGLIWNHIYKREFLNQHHIIFKDNREMTYEDRLFLIEVYHYAKVIARLAGAFYYHVYHQESAGRNYNYKSVRLVINYLLCVYQFLKAHNLYEKESIQYGDGVLLTLYSAFRNELRHKPLKSAFAELSRIRQNKILQQSLRHLLMTRKFKILRTYRTTKVCFLFLVLRIMPSK